MRAKKKSRKIEERTVLLLFQGGKVALRKRADTGLLAGLWEYPNLPESLDEAGALLALAQMGLSAESIAPAGSAKHIFTHIEWDMKGYFAEVSGENDDLIWTDADAFDAFALPTAFKNTPRSFARGCNKRGRFDAWHSFISNMARWARAKRPTR